MPRTGRIALSPMLNEAGKLIGDFTVAKTAEDRFLVWGSSAAQIYHLRWFEAHLPDDGSVAVERLGMRLMGLMLAGPRSRAVLAALTDHDVSNAAFRFMDHRPMDVAGCPALVNRISYTGDLGYEIWVEPAYLRTLYRAIKAAGRGAGPRRLRHARAARRCGWRRTCRPGSPSSARSTAPSRAAWSASCGSTRPTSSAATPPRARPRTGPRLRRVSLAIEAEDADVMGDEPIWARTDRDWGAVAAGARLRRAALRRRRRGAAARPTRGATATGGWSAGSPRAATATRSALSLAQGYLPAGAGRARRGRGLFEVEILGVRRPARIAARAAVRPGRRADARLTPAGVLAGGARALDAARRPSRKGNDTWRSCMESPAGTSSATSEGSLGAAEDFYGEVLGWTRQDAGMEGFDYHLATADGDMVAGLMDMPPDAGAMPPFWMIYFAVDDADKTAADVKAAGGTVNKEPADIPGTGRFAVLADPQGAGFGILQPEPMPGQAGAGNAFDQQKAGHGNWNELMTSDPEAGFGFYSELFGWQKCQAMDMGEMGTYQLFSHDGADIGGMMGLGNSPVPAWLPYFGVNGVDAAIERITAGGKVAHGPMEVPGGAFIAVAQDPQGAWFAVVGPKDPS